LNLYQYDPDVKRLLKHGQLYPDHHSADNEIICDLVEKGIVPCESAGFGIGIERLCRVSLGLDSVHPFVVSPEFNAQEAVVA
jgi:aspartyl/asparaginyl-tRNA synthetase